MIEEIEKKVDVEIVYALLSGKVTNALNATLRKKLQERNVELTPSQVCVLYALWDKNGITQKEIAERTEKDKPSITRILDLMEKDKLITRKMGKEDRRSNIINSTAKADKLKEKVHDATAATLQDCFKGLSEKDVQNVQRLMKHIFNNISKYTDAEN